MFNKKSEISRKQVEEMLKIVHAGDVYRERGGLFKKDGTVTEEPNTGGRFCRSMLILDTNSFDWEQVDALWIANEIEPEEGYFDECCDRCITAEEAKIQVPRLDFVTPAQGKWADAFKVPVAVYQPESKLSIGSFDYYDPTAKSIGVNFYPESSNAGIARKDPKLLTATAQKAIEFIKKREAEITREWMALAQDYAYEENRCLSVAKEVLAELEPLSVEYAIALEKIKHYTDQTQTQTQGQTSHKLDQFQVHALPASADPFEFSEAQFEKIGIPIQAYSQYVANKSWE